MLRLALSEHFMNVNELLRQLNGSGSQVSRPAGSTVKKKQTARSQNKAPATLIEDKPAVQTQPVTEGRVELTGPVDIKLIKTNWQSILASAKAKNAATGGFLDSAEPACWRDSVLTLSFPQSAGFAKQMCEKRKGQIEQLLSEAIGNKTKVQFESSPDQSQGQRTRMAANKKKRDEALDDPAVKTLLSDLNATVTGIDKVED